MLKERSKLVKAKAERKSHQLSKRLGGKHDKDEEMKQEHNDGLKRRKGGKQGGKNE